MAVDLKMEVYTPALELIGFLEIHRSVIWEEKAFTAGSFSVESIITPESLAMLQPENIIWIEGETAGIIEYVQEEAGEDGPYITVKGRMLTGILDRRILWGQYNLKGSTPGIMHTLVHDCCISPTRGDAEARKIPGLVLTDIPPGGETIQIQATGGTLLERLETLGETYGVAFGVRFNAAVPQMEFWTRWGQDWSIHQSNNTPVLYSTELDDVLSSEYTYNSQDYRNVALVAGEGEGAERVYVTVENDVEPTPEPVPPTPPEPPVTETYTVTLLVDPAGGGIASGGKTVAAGVSITVTASPSEGYDFIEWRENGEMVSTNTSYTFTVKNDRTLTAVFAVSVPTYTITATVDPSGSGNVTGAGKYQEGATVNLKATANDGYNFSDWKEGGSAVHSDPEYSFMASSNRDLVAAFAAKPSSRLPDGYTEVKYIQSNGTPYINTSITPMATIKFSIDIELLSAATSIAKYFCGSWYIPTSGTRYWLALSWSTSGITLACGSTTSVATTYTISSDTTLRRMTIVVDYQNKTAYIEGGPSKSISNTAVSTNMTPFTLFSLNNGKPDLSAKLYSCQIYSGDVLTRDFVPCTNPSGAAGLYDLVGGKFYGNAGTGSFTAGPDV